MTQSFLLLFSFFIEAIIMWQYTSNLFVPLHSLQTRLALLSILYTILFLLSLFGNIVLNIAAYFLVNSAFLFTQFKLKLPLALFYSAILTAIMGISELAILGITSWFAPGFITNAGIGLIFFTVFSKIIFFAIIYLLSHLFKGKYVDQEHFDRTDLLLMVIPVSSIFIMFTFLTIGKTPAFVAPVTTMTMITISALFLLLINLLVIGIKQYNQKKSMEFTDMQLLLQKESDSVEYYEMLLSQNENQSILIHDIKKHLQSIELLNEKNEPDKISAYIHQLMDSSVLKETSRICDNEMLNAILCRYIRQCSEKGIDFHADIRSGSIQNIYPYDLTSLFCNLLDNALEAAESIPGSFIELSVQKKADAPFIVIIVINSCHSNPLNEQGELIISHKSDKGKHGFGIRSIKKVVRQYQGNLQMYYDNATATFHTIITLKQKIFG